MLSFEFNLILCPCHSSLLLVLASILVFRPRFCSRFYTRSILSFCPRFYPRSLHVFRPRPFLSSLFSLYFILEYMKMHKCNLYRFLFNFIDLEQFMYSAPSLSVFFNLRLYNLPFKHLLFHHFDLILNILANTLCVLSLCNRLFKARQLSVVTFH